jgi:glycosyltransferase involved in cell wall biosynthesis
MWKRPFALWIGLLASHKSPLEVIEIARMVPQMDFVMVGWPFDRSIANWLQAEKPANLYYLGAVPDDLKNELIEKCCVGLTTSKYEGFGLVPFEFLSAGKPVLAYPLEVFKEVYGNLITYAKSIDEFAQRSRQLCNKCSPAVDSDAVAKRQAKYDLAKAASRIVRRLDARSLLVFTQDVSIGRNEIAGYYLLQWRLWKVIEENGIDLHILANGEKFSTAFNLEYRTTQVGRRLEPLRSHMKKPNQSHGLNRLEKRVADLVIRTVEPMCYVYAYISNRRHLRSKVIIATGYSQIFAGIIVKHIFGFKLVHIVHDARLYRYDLGNSSLFMKIYYLAYTHVLRHVDLILLVSNTVRKEFLNYYPYKDRLMVIWNDYEKDDSPDQASIVRVE